MTRNPKVAKFNRATTLHTAPIDIQLCTKSNITLHLCNYIDIVDRSKNSFKVNIEMPFKIETFTAAFPLAKFLKLINC